MVVKDYASREAERVLADVHPDSAFNLKDGSSIRNLRELYAAIQNAETHVFNHHVNDERNDFSTWVKDIHKDYKLANSLSSAKSRDECAKAVASRIYEVQSAVEKRKSRELQETETAAERLEKILSEAAKAKAVETKKKRELEESTPSVSMVVDLETNETFNVAVDKVKTTAPTAKELLSEPVLALPAPEVKAADPCTELLEFAEPKRFHRQFGKEMSSIFSGSTMKSFASEMKNLFRSGNAAEEKFLKELEKPRGSPAIRPKASKTVDTDEKKEKIISHLKRVYE